MRILIITSCTGEKAIRHERALTLADFREGREHVGCRETELSELLTPAEELYSGLQHARLMRGVYAARTATGANEIAADLWILSAGYGLIPGSQRLAPYECTFQGMNRSELLAWARQLGVANRFRDLLDHPYDLGLVLLGDDYLTACEVDASLHLAGPTLIFCSAKVARRLPSIENLHPVVVTNAEASRFSCGLVGLKGELGARVLEHLVDEPSSLHAFQDRATDTLTLLTNRHQVVARPPSAKPRRTVDEVITISEDWWHKPHRSQLSYFIPEWDDLVDPDYDFTQDLHSGGTGDWSNEVYAHQLYPEPNYDGILISKVVAEKTKKKRERINELGVHRFLRVPRTFPVMGDCGAFGYIMDDTPPYSTDEILDYYTALDFDFGVSVDHLIVTATQASKQARYDLTIHNANEFLREHRKRGLAWEPIGAVQGWDAASYAEAARQTVAMGYRYIALGGLVRTTTREILSVLEAVHQVVPPAVKIHLFGLARLAALREFAALGVRSVDSASLLRRAWMGTGQNYLSESGEFFAAIRIPEAGKSFRAKRMVGEGRADQTKVERLERACLDAMHAFDRGQVSVEQTLDVLQEYDHLITPDRPDTRPLLRRTLEAMPWKECPCDICRRDGIDVIIFRGNNRNRRRGFHNTWVFYRLIQRVLAGEDLTLRSSTSTSVAQQLPLFAAGGTD